MDNDIVLFETGDKEIKLSVPIEQETVWLTQAQMVELFERDISVISRHINNIFKEDEVEKVSNLHFLQIANSDRAVTVLTGGITASAAESFLLMMKNDDRAVLIGERSAGTNGMPLIHSLPGGGKYAVCTQKCLTDDMVDYNNVGIKPNIECYITLKDYENNYDRVMAEGLSYFRNR